MRVLAGAVVVALLAAICYFGYQLFSKARTVFLGQGCAVTAKGDDVQLSLSQGANAATIAGVAHRKRLPERAVVIAYATAEQESHIENLDYGDRDSLGIFQQRPSQGWGSPDQLQDPVYASTKFFDALEKVDGYTDRELHVAAQEVQRSFDGTLYAQHEPMAAILAQGYTGAEPAAVTCWYRVEKDRPSDTKAAFSELRRTFGKSIRTQDGAIRVPAEGRTGWTVASWAVSHASVYGITEVRYAGRVWTAKTGHDGWSKDTEAPTDRILLR